MFCASTTVRREISEVVGGNDANDLCGACVAFRNCVVSGSGAAALPVGTVVASIVRLPASDADVVQCLYNLRPTGIGGEAMATAVGAVPISATPLTAGTVGDCGMLECVSIGTIVDVPETIHGLRVVRVACLNTEVCAPFRETANISHMASLMCESGGM